MTQRPRGVLAIVIILIILAVLGIIVFMQISTAVSILQNLIFLHLFAIFYTLCISTTPLTIFKQFGILLNIYNVTNLMSQIFIYQLFAVAALVISGLFILSCVGLLYMKKWGHKLALILGILDVIGSVLAILAVGLIKEGIISLILGIIIVAYLMGKVEKEFK